MTPFQEDVINLACNLWINMKRNIKDAKCYFLGHKFGSWKEYSHGIKAGLKERKCKACGKLESKVDNSLFYECKSSNNPEPIYKWKAYGWCSVCGVGSCVHLQDIY